jgi:hypothetical protein
MTPVVRSEASVRTPKASIYLKQLCRHFGHKREAQFTDEQGRIEFEYGVCELSAGQEVLVLRASAADEESVARLEQVIGSHLERFAHRDSLEVNWSR